MGNWNDGGLPIGSRKVKIYPQGASDASSGSTWNGTTAKGIYILENFSPSRPQNVLSRMDEAGNPNGGAGIDGVVEGSAVAQLPNTATDLLDTGDAFATKRRNAAQTVEAFVITGVDEPESQGEIRKQSFRYRKIVAQASGSWPAVYP